MTVACLQFPRIYCATSFGLLRNFWNQPHLGHLGASRVSRCPVMQRVLVSTSVHMLGNSCRIHSWKQNLWVSILITIELGILSSSSVFYGLSVAHGSDSWNSMECVSSLALEESRHWEADAMTSVEPFFLDHEPSTFVCQALGPLVHRKVG